MIRSIGKCLFCFYLCIATAGAAGKRRIEVLFFGDDDHHRPLEMYRLFKEQTGGMGINLTYEKRMEDLTPGNLQKYDVVLVFANHQQITPEQLGALEGFVKDGGGLMPVHCGSACFKKTDGYVDLIGGQIEGHGEGVFTARVVDVGHPAMKGYEPFTSWDETYRHHRLGKDIGVLMKREEEPWTWVKDYGKGRVFYTASGHDERIWSLPGFHDLLERGIRWAAGPGDFITAADLPALKYEIPLLPDSFESARKVPKVQEPLSPEDSIRLAQVPAGFRLELFAAEPEIVNPIAIAWDAKGRLFVVESLDYPNDWQEGKSGHDRIKVCEDMDGDGRADQFTIFADGLSMATSVVILKDDVIATDGTRIISLKDTDGDGKADERKVLLDGFKMHDTHACVSNLKYGFDGWIWGTIGYAGFEGTVGGKKVKFDTGVFRFRQDGSEIEFLEKTTNNTWGLGFTDDFEVVGSTANRQPGWQLVGDGGKSHITSTDNLLFPTTVDVQQSDSWDAPIRELGEGRTAAYAHRFTAGAGFAPMTGGRFPVEWKDKAFVCGPTGHQVATVRMSWKGADGVVDLEGNNLYVSSDAWSAPVAAETGPDGAVWIADWYNIIVQHNRPGAPFEGSNMKKGKGGAYMTPLRDKAMGRIYRVFPNGSENKKAPENTAEWIIHPNLFWRLEGQKELSQATDFSSVNSLWSAHNLGLLDSGMLKAALANKSPSIRRTALAVWPTGSDSVFPELDVDAESDPFVLREWLRLVAKWTPDESLGRKLRALSRSKPALRQGEVIERCYAAACVRHATGFLLAALELAPDPKVLEERIFPAAIESLKTSPSAQVMAAAGKSDSPVARRILEVMAEQAVKKKNAIPLDRMVRGEAVYGKTCIACHQADGEGTPGAFPPLNGSVRAGSEAGIPIRIVLHGLMGKTGDIDSLMPPVAGLTDKEIADVLSYIRVSWKNDAAPVSEQEVAVIREATEDRKVMWTTEELKAD